MKKEEFKKRVESRTFGRNSGILSLTVEPKNFRGVAEYLRSEAEMELDFVEAITAFALDKAIIVSWFMRSYHTDVNIVLRTSLDKIHSEREPVIESVADLWPMARAFEEEISTHFGVRFDAA